MLWIIIMAVFANGSIAFNEMSVDGKEDIDMGLLETMLETSRNITGFAVYTESDTEKGRYDYYDFVSYNWIDHNSYIIDKGGFNYAYIGDDIEF